MSKISTDLVVRASATLTATAVAATAVDVKHAYEGILSVTYTPKAAQSNRNLTIIVYTSPDNSTYYQETSTSLSSGTVTHYVATHVFTGATGGTAYTYTISIPLAHKYLKVYANEDGSDNFGTAAISLTYSEEV